MPYRTDTEGGGDCADGGVGRLGGGAGDGLRAEADGQQGDVNVL
ncbi:hypothetical protein ACWD0J_17890 [Streptomyces sp. NPDC003011]